MGIDINRKPGAFPILEVSVFGDLTRGFLISSLRFSLNPEILVGSSFWCSAHVRFMPSLCSTSVLNFLCIALNQAPQVFREANGAEGAEIRGFKRTWERHEGIVQGFPGFPSL